MRGLAWRWIGLHAAAFASNLLSHFLLRWLYPDWRDYFGWLAQGTQALIFAVVLGFGQAWTLRGSLPVSAARWRVATLGGVLLGRLAVIGLGWSHTTLFLSLYRSKPHLAEIMNAGFTIAYALTAGLLLGLAQALALRPAASRGRAVRWGMVVCGAWVAADLAFWGLGRITSWADMIRTLPQAVYVFLALSAATEGALFAALTLPVLRKSLAQDRAQTA